ncbi:MAG: NADH-quinone oxidoreductase subunit C [Methanomassiliicoccaceae archaeon]|nr:NADH-quinone oxidoreductase subunit C [Methanomassiliicoccaceae archaeon]
MADKNKKKKPAAKPVEEKNKKPSVEDIKNALRSNFDYKIDIWGTADRRLFAKANKDYIHDICSFIHDELFFEHTTSIMGNDMKDYMEVIYHLTNYYSGTMIELMVELQLDDLKLRSVADIWGGANWHERETYELFGIVFEGHPKLERLLTPDTYEFYPFRKSYKLRGQE